MVHCFKAHVIASIMSYLKIEKTSDTVQHSISKEWLEQTAETLVSATVMPSTSTDPVHNLHRSFLHLSFLYVDLREAIRWENGPHVIRHWKLWIPRFLATGCKNYASEAVHLIANLTAIYPKHISYIITHNRTVNTRGKAGHGKPIDQHLEHYNL